MSGDSHQGVERREAPRMPAVGHGIVAVRIRPGRDASIVDVSAGGVLIETVHRLLPGMPIELHLTTRERRVAMRGRVLRCVVVRLAPTLRYRGAIGFDRHLGALLETGPRGYAVPAREHCLGDVLLAERADVSQAARP